jgi:DNA-binding transcriptional LysR family regulator
MTQSLRPASPGFQSSATDRIELMQTFVRIVEAGSLSAAATQLGTTQPTVSRRLQLLERSLGVRLLQRSTHAMKLSEEGERCFDRAKELLAGWAAFDADLRGMTEEPEGALRIVVPHAFGQQQLVEPLAVYMRRHPKVNVEWLLHDKAPDFIPDGVDCAIHVGQVDDPSVVAIKLAEVPRIIVAAPSVLADAEPPQHASELARLPWLALQFFYRRDVSFTHTITGETCRLALRPRMSTDSLYALRSAALQGLGACVASAWVLTDDLAEGRLVRLLPDWEASPLPVHLVYPYARFYPARLRRFIETMREMVPTAFGGGTTEHAVR